MGHIFCLMGKSASGKDTLYGKLLSDDTLGLQKVVPYTTRPIRSGEAEGREYHFTDIDTLNQLEKDGKVIEHRCYNTFYGDWHYFTANDGQIDLEKSDYVIIGTLQSYTKFCDYFSKEKVIPMYIHLDDGERLQRALLRERQQESPKYEEMCRRFLADSQDFSDENLEKAGVTKKYINDDLDACLDLLRKKIWTLKSIK